MAKTGIRVRKAETIFDELNQLHHEISQRAYDLFRNGGMRLSGALEDWLNAERELVWKPAVELRRKDNQFEVLAAMAGVEPKDLDVRVTPEDVLISANIEHEHAAEEGAVRVCEFSGGKLFRAIHFPEKIDPNSVKAEYRNGLLRLTAAIAKTVPTKKKVKAT